MGFDPSIYARLEYREFCLGNGNKCVNLNLVGIGNGKKREKYAQLCFLETNSHREFIFPQNPYVHLLVG